MPDSTSCKECKEFKQKNTRWEIYTAFIKWISTIKDYSVHASKRYKLKLQSHTCSKVKFTIVNGLKASHYVELLMQTLHYLHIGAHKTLAMKTICLQSCDSSAKTYYAGLITSSGVMQQTITLVSKWSNKTV